MTESLSKRRTWLEFEVGITRHRMGPEESYMHLPPLLQQPQLPISGRRRSIARPNTLDHPSHTLRHALLLLGHWSLVFDPCAMSAESLLRPSEMSIHRALSAPVAWVFELRRLQRIGGTASPRSTAKGDIHVLKPYHPNDAIATSLSAPSGRHDCRLR